MRKTKIICTIGPSSESEERLRELMIAGMNVARFNFSHGTHEEHKKKFDRVIKVSSELGMQVATMLDTKGPEIRLKDIEGGRTELVSGQKFILTTEDILGYYRFRATPRMLPFLHAPAHHLNTGLSILDSSPAYRLKAFCHESQTMQSK